VPEALYRGLIAVVPWVNLFILFYYVIVNGVYFALLLVASVATERHRKGLRYGLFSSLVDSPTTPPVTVIVPAYNEAPNIAQTVRSLLALNYASHEVLVVDDGSTDGTLEELEAAFGLIEVDLIYRAHIPTGPVERFFVSPDNPGLTVVRKANTGKADSLNVGINLARSPYFCSVDADSLLERNALLRLMGPIVASPDRVVATGGIVRIANGCVVRDGQIEEVRLPKDFLSRLQVVEYLRCFLFGRTGWSSLGSLLILSGTFSLFHRQTVLDVGGYNTRTVSEDMELVVRLHHRLAERGTPYRITFVADPICWTEAPATLRQLGRQRRRWHCGLGESVLGHWPMIANPRYGQIGLFGMPFQLVELFGPLVELGGYLVVGAAALLGVLSLNFLVLYIVLAFLMGVFLSVGAVLLEELTERRYPRWGDLVRLLLFAVLENFGYRQLNVFWRVGGLVQLMNARRRWEVVEKEGLHTHANPSAPTPKPPAEAPE
jgi:cellulose synthase/poly-beta-1,6-N-acetylglucosamine synthase-like glycosyltransferase